MRCRCGICWERIVACLDKKRRRWWSFLTWSRVYTLQLTHGLVPWRQVTTQSRAFTCTLHPHHQTPAQSRVETIGHSWTWQHRMHCSLRSEHKILLSQSLSRYKQWYPLYKQQTPIHSQPLVQHPNRRKRQV